MRQFKAAIITARRCAEAAQRYQIHKIPLFKGAAQAATAQTHPYDGD